MKESQLSSSKQNLWLKVATNITAPQVVPYGLHHSWTFPLSNGRINRLPSPISHPLRMGPSSTPSNDWAVPKTGWANKSRPKGDQAQEPLELALAFSFGKNLQLLLNLTLRPLYSSTLLAPPWNARSPCKDRRSGSRPLPGWQS